MARATMSIDWEDLGQMYGKYHYGKITEPVRGTIERQTKIILDLFDETDNKATFFILGALASYRPQLVKEIAARGHEIALHGQNHDPMFKLTRAKAIEDISTAHSIVTNITGEPVFGYRAPFFSIKKENLYLLEVLADLGLQYDSSIFPILLPRYGIKNFSPEDSLYQLPGGKQIVELPMTVASTFGRQWPVSGGGYMRLMPSFLVKRVFDNIAKGKKDSMIYMHPYEFDSRPIDISSNYPDGVTGNYFRVKALNVRWNILRPTIITKLRALLKSHQFITAVEKAADVRKKSAPVPLHLG